jgi:hypothetical protein
VLELVSADNQFTQTIRLDGTDRRWDVVQSVLRDARGNELWRLDNKDFSELATEDGATVRVPGKTRFQQPPVKADLIVRWGDRTLNLELSADKFEMEIPDGLPPC